MLAETINADKATSPPGLAVIEATIAAGTLLERSKTEPTGRKWRVRVFEYGLSRNRYPYRPANESEPRPEGSGYLSKNRYPTPPLPSGRGSDSLPLLWTKRSAEAALRRLEGARCFADHVSVGTGLPACTTTGVDACRHLTGKNACPTGHSVRDLVGFFSDSQMGPRGPEATLTLLESESWAREKLLTAWQAGRMDLIGFSVDAVIGVRAVGEGAERALEVEDIVAIHSVDMVSAASSGGQALAVLEEKFTAEDAEERRESIESKTKRLCALCGETTAASAVKSRSAENRGNEKGERVMENENKNAPQGSESPPGSLGPGRAGGGVEAAQLPESLKPIQEEVKKLRQQIEGAQTSQRLAENRWRLDGKLAASRLPKPLAELVASRFQAEGPGEPGREISEEEVEMEIQRVREAYAALSPVGKVVETGRVKVVREPEERWQMALDRLFGLPVEDTSVPAFRGIREAYVAYTGDGEITGLLAGQLRIREELSSATFPNALANTLRRMLLKEYGEQDYGIRLLAQSSSVPDFRTQERIRVGYFGDLPTVDPEAADYDELTAPTDEKASYAVVTFGGLVTVTRKMIINDDLGVVPQIVSRLGRSARRTLAQRVFNLMINNAAIYDSVAWFHATHGNLGSTALSATELDVVRTAMRNRTEKDSGKKLGIAPYVLVVPHELEGKARQENMREYLDASFTPNPVRFLFGANGERIIVSPLLTDTNDWYVFANVAEAPTVEAGFLQGRQEPEFFLADNPSAGTVFTSDRIRYKVRHEFEAVVIDFRGAYKEAVA